MQPQPLTPSNTVLAPGRAGAECCDCAFRIAFDDLSEAEAWAEPHLEDGGDLICPCCGAGIAFCDYTGEIA